MRHARLGIKMGEIMKLMDMTAVELGGKIRSGEVSVKEAAMEALANAKGQGEKESGYITVLEEEAVLNRAEEVQSLLKEGGLSSPLAGVPVAIMDNLCTKGVRTTCGSKMLEDFVPTYTATAVTNIEDKGAVVIGKADMGEFAMEATGTASHGAGAAITSGGCAYALAFDTGGALRQTGAFYGLTGMKPTYGTVSRHGAVAYGSSLDQVGPVAKDVADCAAILEAIASHDPMDGTSIGREDYGFCSALEEGVKGMRIGIPKGYMGGDLNSEVEAAVRKAADDLAAQGAEVEEFDLGLVEYAVPAFFAIASAEASSNLSRFEGVRYGYRTRTSAGIHDMYKKTRAEGFGDEVKRRIMIGSFILSKDYYEDYYVKALRARAMIKAEFDKAFGSYDLILGPVTATTAPMGDVGDPVKAHLGELYTVSANLAGLPAISVPCGKDANGRPIGLQLIGDCYKERDVIRAARAYEGVFVL